MSVKSPASRCPNSKALAEIGGQPAGQIISAEILRVLKTTEVGFPAPPPRTSVIQLPSRPHHDIFSDLWLAVPGHDDALTGTNLELSRTRSENGRLSEYYLSPSREQALRE